MPKKIFLSFLLLFSLAKGKSQETAITGNWYSKDGSRQYLIIEKEKGWEAILLHSQRENDPEGKLVLSRLQKKKNRYRGFIYSVKDDLYTTVTLRTNRKNQEVLVLKLKRMLLLDVTIKWYRTPKQVSL